MAENSAIEWTDNTFNPWVGCTKISPACDNCYAEGWAKRSGMVKWGNHPRRRTSAANWAKPLKWNRDAAGAGTRPKVFCASLADWLDNKADPEWRADLGKMIEATPNLDWLLLTKRPQNWKDLTPWPDGPPPNVWIGVTVENQEQADIRIPALLSIPAAGRFLSVEPMLGPVDLSGFAPFCFVGSATTTKDGLVFLPELEHEGGQIDWIIAGGESGPGYRAPDPAWFRSLRDECAAAGVPFLFKQWGGLRPKDGGRTLDGVIHDGYPASLERTK